MQNGIHTPETPQPETSQDERRDQAPPRRRRDLPYKVTFLAGFLSGIVPGVGHIYVGYFREGFTIQAVLALLIVVLSSGIDPLMPLAIVGIVFTYFYGIIDAVRRAQFYNLALDNDGETPDIRALEIPGRRGSRVGGIVLIVLGSIIFLDINFNLDFSWLENWWPLGLVALGVWLVLKARQDSDSSEADRPGYDDKRASSGDR